MKPYGIVYSLFLFSVSLFGQDEVNNPLVPHQNSIELGFQLGGGIVLPQSVNNLGSNVQMTPSWKFLYLGTLVDAKGQTRTSLYFPRTFGVQAAFRRRGENPENSWAVKLGINRTQIPFYFDYPEAAISPNPNLILAGWVQDVRYTQFSVGIQRQWAGWYAQGMFSYATNIKEDGNILPSSGTSVYNYTDNLGYGAIANVSPQNGRQFIVIPEVGIHRIYKQTVPYELGIGLHIPLQKAFSQRFDLYASGTEIARNQIDYSLGGVYVNLTVPITVAKFPKFAPKKKIDIPKPEKPKDPEKEVVVENTPRKEVKKFTQQESFTVTDPKVTVKFWDNHTPDGDIISLYLNGELLVSKQKVDSRPKELTVTLKPGANYLVLRAMNEGRIPPNTTAISVNDGAKTETAILRAKRRRNVAIKIMYEPK